MTPMRLKGKSAVVTGGAQGIGRAIVERLLSSGVSVAIWDRDGMADALRAAGDDGDAVLHVELVHRATLAATVRWRCSPRPSIHTCIVWPVFR